jgi:heptosyltransferase-2
MSNAVHKILVIRLSSLGDLVLMVPMLRALRSGFPGAEIHLLCKEKYAGLFDGSDFLNRIVEVRRGDFKELIRIRSWLGMERYDVIMDAHGMIRSTLLFRTLRAPRKLRIGKDEVKKLLLIRGKTNLYGAMTSQTARYAELAGKLGTEVTEAFEGLPVPERAAERAERELARVARDGAPLVAFAPGARWVTKMWPKEYYAQLITEIQRRGFGTILIGGAEDSAVNAEIARISPGVVDLTGSLSIIESAAVLKRCGTLVTNDSAPLHLAEAVGTPVVAFFGPTVREFGYFPRLAKSRVLEVAVPCRPCSRNGARTCPYGTRECLTTITPSDALGTIIEVLGEKQVPQ